MTKKRRRPIHLHVMVSEEELALIRTRMAEAGVRNMGAYVRKMALNGYVLHVDLGPVRELVSLQRRCSNNLNQVAIQANTYGGIYPQDIAAKGLRRPMGAAVRPGGKADPGGGIVKQRESNWISPVTLPYFILSL